MLTVENLSVYYGDMMALEDLNLDVSEGQIVSLLGSNGSGKTTLIRAISGLLKPKRGRITFDGLPIEKATPHAIVHAGLIQVPEGRKLFPEMTVLENLELGGYNARARASIPKSLEHVFSLFPVLKNRRHQIAGTLSGGEQQMVAIARGLMALPKLLVLDEPSLGLAPLIVDKIFETIQQVAQERITVFLVEQNVHQALSLSNWAFVLENGRIVLKGSGAALLANQHVKDAYLGL